MVMADHFAYEALLHMLEEMADATPGYRRMELARYVNERAWELGLDPEQYLDGRDHQGALDEALDEWSHWEGVADEIAGDRDDLEAAISDHIAHMTALCKQEGAVTKDQIRKALDQLQDDINQ